jgi:hypothetical protein
MKYAIAYLAGVMTAALLLAIALLRSLSQAERPTHGDADVH